MHLRIVLALAFLAFPFVVSADITVSEVCWMGRIPEGSETQQTASNKEWLELYNSGDTEVNLEGWSLEAEDGTPNILLSGIISPKGYFLLERTSDDSASGATANIVYSGALGNDGEVLFLKDAGQAIVEKIDASGGWPAGDNTAKKTMHRSGTGWVTAWATPKAPLETSSIQVEDQPIATSTLPAANSPESSGASSLPYIPIEKLPRLKAYAGEDKHIVAGEEVFMEGFSLGFDNEPLENPRYLWNFGDATVKEGTKAPHIFMFPGTYTVRMTVSSGSHTAFDDVIVRVSRNSVFINELKAGDTGWIELENKGSQSVSLAGWQIVKGGAEKAFIFPPGTIIAPRSFIVISVQSLSFSLAPEADSVKLLYPNGAIADSLSYSGYYEPDKSAVRVEGVLAFLPQTPGEHNSLGGKSEKIEEVVFASSKIPNPPASSSFQPAIAKNAAVEASSKVLENDSAETGADPGEREEDRPFPEESVAASIEDAVGETNGSFMTSIGWFLLAFLLGCAAAVLVVFYRARSVGGS